MPIYEYQCHKCEQVTEAMQKFSDKPLTKCPACGGKLSKLMSMNSFQLKGGGWYVTDYAKKGPDAKGGKASEAVAEVVKKEKKETPKKAKEKV